MTQYQHTRRAMVRTEAAARYTGLSISSLEKLRLTGGGPKYIKLGRTVVYDPGDLDVWLSDHRRSSTSCVETAGSKNRRGSRSEGSQNG